MLKPSFFRPIAVACGLLAAALFTACSAAAPQAPAAPAAPSAPAAVSAPAVSAPASAAAPAQAAASTTGDIGLEKARAIALQAAGFEASQVSIALERSDREDGIMVYDIEFVVNSTLYKYEIAASDGSVRESSQEAVAQGAAPAAGQITAEQAKAAALTQAGLSEAQVTITKLALDYDDGRAEYDVEFYANGTEYSYTIDATTGAVLESEQDRG